MGGLQPAEVCSARSQNVKPTPDRADGRPRHARHSAACDADARDQGHRRPTAAIKPKPPTGLAFSRSCS